MGVRFEMGQEAVAAQTDTLLAMGAELGEGTAQTLEGEAETQFWAALAHETTTSHTQTMLTLKANLLPTDVTHWLTHVERLCEQQHIRATWYAHAGHGLVTVRLAGDDTALLSATSTLRHIAGEQQGRVVVTEAPLGLDLDVWGPVPALAVMRNLKMRFDPKNTLNPGRFVGGL